MHSDIWTLDELMHDYMDTVYDGATNMKSTAFLYGPKGGRWCSAQAYGASFRSATPRPWQRVPTVREAAHPPITK